MSKLPSLYFVVSNVFNKAEYYRGTERKGGGAEPAQPPFEFVPAYRVSDYGGTVSKFLSVECSDRAQL